MANVKSKWTIEADDRTKAAFATATQNARGFDRVISDISRRGGLGAVLGAVGLGTTMGLVSKEVNETADSLDSLAKRARALGMTSEEFDTLEYAAGRARISSDQLGVGLKTLMRQMSDTARGTGEGRIAFKALGIDVNDTFGHMKSATSIMAEVADRLGTLGSAEERAAMLQKLFGESGAGMVNMLKDGSVGFRDAIAEGYALGARYDEMTTRGEEFNDAQLRLNRAIRSTKDAVVSQALPGLTLLAEAISGHVMRAVTGLDEEFRMFLGNMRTLPAEMALDEMARKEQELLAAVAATNAELEQRRAAAGSGRVMDSGLMGAHAWKSPQYSDMISAGAAANDARTELAALRKEIERTKADMARTASIRKFYSGDGNDTDGDSPSKSTGVTEPARREQLTDAEREATRVRESLMTATDRFNAEETLFNQLLASGLLTADEHARAMANLKAAIVAASPEQQRLNELMEAGRAITVDMQSPLQQYQASMQRLDEMLAIMAINTETYTRAQAQYWNEYQQQMQDVNGTTEEAMSTLDQVGVESARSFGQALSSMVFGAKDDLDGLAAYAERVADRIADALLQYAVIDPLIASITKGNSTSALPPAGFPGGPLGPPSPMSTDKSAPGGVTININAVDTAGAVRVIRNNEATILGMVQKAYNRAGRSGPLG